MRILWPLIIVLCSVSFAHAAVESPSVHPTVAGAWDFMPMAGECSDEKFQFLSNGTLLITSSDEAIESLYELSTSPSSTGSFKLIFTLTKHSGKKGCADQEGEVGDKITLFMRFHVSGDQFLLCDTDGLDKCFGQATRVREHGPYEVDKEANKIMESVVAAYRAVSTYSDQGHSVQTLGHEVGEQESETTIEFETLFKRPQKFRFAWSKNDNYSNIGKVKSAIWSDGVKVWSSKWFDGNKTTLEKDFSTAVAGSEHSAHIILTLLSNQVGGFRLDQLQGLKVVEKQTIDGIESDVLSGHYYGGGECRIWVGKKDSLIRKIVEPSADGTTFTEERTNILVNQDIADTRFKE